MSQDKCADVRVAMKVLRLWRRAFCVWLFLFLATVMRGPGQQARWYQLSEQVVQLSDQGKYADAIPVAQQVVSIAESTYGANDVHTGLSLNRLGMLLQDVNRYADAEPIFKRALGIMIAAHGENNSEVATVLGNLGNMYREAGRLEDAEKYGQQALAIQEKVLGPDDVHLGVTINNLAVTYKDEGKYKEAEPLFRRALAIDEKAGTGGRDLALDLSNLATIVDEEGKYADAEQLNGQALALDVRALGNAHPQIALDLANSAATYEHEGKYSQAEPLFVQALKIQQQAAPTSAQMGWLLGGLGTLYESEGRYNEAAGLMASALKVQAKALGPDHPEVASTLNNLGGVYDQLGKYGDAENFYKAAINIREKKLGPMHPLLALTLSNLANIYLYDGRWGEAEALFRRAMDIDLKTYGQENPRVAVVLHGMAEMYHAEGKLADAERMLRGALAIDTKTFGPSGVEVAKDLFTLGGLLEDAGRTAEAGQVYQQCLTIAEKAQGPNHPDVATDLVSLGTVDEREGKYVDAEPLFKRALTIDDSVLGSAHPNTDGIFSNLAVLYYAWDKPEQAEPYFDRHIGSVLEQFKERAGYMTERQRLIFLATIPGTFPIYFSFALKYHDKLPDLSGKMYDALLAEKGFVAESSAALRAKILASGDKQTLAMLDKLTAEKTALAGMVESTQGDPADRRKQISQLTGEADQLEQQIVQRSARLADEKALSTVTWHDVQKALKPGEAAVEVTRFPFHNGKSFTSTAYYVALIVKPESKAPEFVVLGEALKMEATPVASFRAGVGQTRGLTAEPEAGQTSAETGAAGDTHAAYAAFWKPLEPALGTAKRVYLSPDGTLNQIPVGLLADDAGKLVMEKYQVRVVNSTKDLLRTARGAQAKSALLVGNPKFDLSEAEEKAAQAQVSGVAQTAGAVVPVVAERGEQRSGELAGGALNPLPGTQAEVNAVDGLMKSAGWQPALYTGDLALKEVVESARGPRVVHLATHGFFLSDQQMAQAAKTGGKAPMQDPMLRSGLFFAGADRVREGAGGPGGDDGVLTAYEASQLNLEGTELVVLSACETGLGQQTNGEGVFGLRRGLQEAGADAVMMSMWSVPDKETQELMALFYDKWLGGMEKPEALRQAQLEEREVVRKRYGKDLPYYWGAFVMVSR